jgi:septum formation protein
LSEPLVLAPIVLASGSASRARLLKAAGVSFVIDPADIDETAPPDAKPESLATTLARAKALAVSNRHPDSLVLGGDSVLDFAGQAVGKSPDLAAARALLSLMSGKSHRIVSAAALARKGQIVWQYSGEGRLAMRAFSAQFLDDYLAVESPAILASVGCYHLEGRGAQLFDRVDGDIFSILGLPLLSVLAALRQHGALNS